MARALASIAAALAALTGLVEAGVLTDVDNWAIDHVMPALNPYANVPIVTSGGLWRPFPLDAAWWDKLLDVYLYPASFLISAALVVACCTVLARRERVAAGIWLGAWLGANAVELAGKLALERPAVHWSNGPRPVHVASFDHSYPSGHTARAVVLAALVGYVLPRARVPVALWAVLVPPALVVAGAHTVSDVVGGGLLGLLLAVGAHAIIGRWTPSPTSSGASSAESSPARTRSSRTSREPASTSPTPS